MGDPRAAKATMVDFFISYTAADQQMAEWIAWQLEDFGYATRIQAWDSRPGNDFVAWMDRAVREADRILVVLSPAYEEATSFTVPEWAAALGRDPSGRLGVLLPVRVVDFTPGGLFRTRTWIDLAGIDKQTARAALLAGIQATRAKPLTEPDVAEWVDKSGAADPFGTHWISAGRPVLDRQVLRRSLRGMMDPLGRKILIVNGPPGSGKSFTSLFIEYIAYRTGAFRVTTLVLNRAGGPTYRSVDLARDLVTRMGRSVDSIPQRPEPTERYLSELADWLLAQAEAGGSDWWWILDGFSSGDIPPDTRLLVQMLAQGVQRPSVRVRLVLLDFDESLPVDIAPYVYREQLMAPKDIGAVTIREFVEGLLKRSGKRMISYEVDRVIQLVLDGLPASAERLRELSRRLLYLAETLELEVSPEGKPRAGL